jgi:hypothetical protein
MGERERLRDDDLERDDARVLPQPANDDELAVERDDQARAGGLASLQLEHGTLNDEPRLAGEDHVEVGGTTTPTSLLGAIRFGHDAALADVASGKSTLNKGSAGIHVSKVQQALAELGLLDGAYVSGTVDDKTVDAIKQFQVRQGLTESGKVDAATMVALDGKFTGYAVEALRAKSKKASLAPKGTSYAKGSAPKELLDGTHKPTTAEKKAFADAISTEQVAGAFGGRLPTFKNEVGGETYEQRLEALVDRLIDSQLTWAKKDETTRSTGHVYQWGDIDKVAQQSADATDAIFGKYARGNALQGTGPDANIKDAWETKTKELTADPSLGDGWAQWRVEKLLTGSKQVKELDKEHGAIQTRATEKAIVDRVHAKLATSRKADLILIHKAWPAYASGTDVFIQRAQHRDAAGKIDNAKSRDYMWKQFQTIIHEYIHTLEHKDHVMYRRGLGQQKGGFTLREGVTDYFTKVVYNNTDKTPALRTAVEGPFHDAGVTHTVGNLTTYGESENAERGAGIVGFDNMAAAFFLGHTALLGG